MSAQTGAAHHVNAASNGSSNVSTTLSLAVAIGDTVDIPTFTPDDPSTPVEGALPTTMETGYRKTSYHKVIAHKKRPQDRMAYFASDEYVVDDTTNAAANAGNAVGSAAGNAVEMGNMRSQSLPRSK